MTDGKDLVPAANQEIIEASGVNDLLSQIRPQWQAKNLIQRVNRILPVDPSSACQRVFNAAIHDLKEKIVIAGMDIAIEAAKQYKLPPISKPEDVENYTTSRIIELAYRMGLLSRPGWRRILRAYDIRKDLEHEDDEYEAGVEDCVYIFKTCIDVVLSKDPVHLLKLTDIKEIVEKAEPAALNQGILEDFEHAPGPRQLEIYRFLLSSALNVKHPDVIRQNCYSALHVLRSIANTQVLITGASEFVEKIGKRGPTLVEVRVAYASGLLPYLKKAQLRYFYASYFSEMKKISYRWGSYNSHGELLRNLEEIGGLDYCPDEYLDQYVEWLVLCYIGEPGGRTSWGNIRNVYYSNIGAPISLRLLSGTTRKIYDFVLQLEKTNKIARVVLQDEHVARRYHTIIDSLET